jgi:hypothetical protein
MRLFWITIVLASMSVTIPAHAKVRARLTKECQTMALQAHPRSLPDLPAVANLRHNYDRLCIARRGTMDPELNP